ncbi:hypothetical protein P153DRAFT_353902 [Dothidotthia symphoricarpi CBS 119687]|uniref:Uncharacterized protein n=1 Tax=Dothidotthia symphoricarpi CBS 119687 TaxID=1392245 RepID=A0A6A6ANS4_9PLEO|nr:uncharacterized protein P153DRAFT_353902 [Dothidotthia symphoricarpi CBS 119687]KAF2133569.1 hypothetical protein P153DRAFT_353902 [Dothidotthia symphoricarpi CBS 119687]
MSGLEVVAAVSAVISAFHGGSELLKHLKQKRRNARTQAQQEFEERQLQDSLETGEHQIGFRYAQDMKELGDHIRVGDAVARDRLLHIAVIMQAEIIKSLQMAVKYENAVLNLKILHEASIMNRKDTFVTLDELKQRILVTRPLTRQLQQMPRGPTNRFSETSVHTMQANNYSPTSPIPDNYIPTAVTISTRANSKEEKRGLAHYFQMKRRNSMSTSSAAGPSNTSVQAANINFSAALEQLVDARGTEDRATIMEDIDEIISSYKSLQVNHGPSDPWSGHQNLARRDTLATLNANESNQRNSTGLNGDAMQMLQNSPQTSEENRADGPLLHPAFNQNFFGAQHDQGFCNQQYMAKSPFRHIQQQSDQHRWSTTSASSSTHSEAQSLDRNSSSSSKRSLTQTPPHSPQPDHSCHSPLSMPSHTQYQQVNANGSIHSPPLTPYTSADLTFTTPIAPLSPQQPRRASSTSTNTPLWMETSPHAPNASRMNMSPVSQTQFTTPHQPHSPSPTSFTSSRQLSTPCIQEEDKNTKPPRPRYHLTPSVVRDTASTHSDASECTITASVFATAAATATATATAPAAAGLRHDSASAPSRTSTDSSLSATMGILPGRSGLRGSIRSDTIQGGPADKQNMMDGRPCKDNNYWGFCKGAWAVREDVKKGLAMRTLPQGMYNTKTIWECQTCSFKGDTFSAPHPTKKNKREMVVDPQIYKSKAGVRYRWIFLAKSHVKKKTSEGSYDDGNYGCVFCSVEGNVTGIYGSVETLMNHVWSQHVAGMSEKTRLKTRCILGRVAGADETFDINIPIFTQVQEMES